MKRRFVFSLYEVFLVYLRGRVDRDLPKVVVVVVVPPLLPRQGEECLLGGGVVAVLYHWDAVLTQSIHFVATFVGRELFPISSVQCSIQCPVLSSVQCPTLSSVRPFISSVVSPVQRSVQSSVVSPVFPPVPTILPTLPLVRFPESPVTLLCAGLPGAPGPWYRPHPWPAPHDPGHHLDP